MRTVDQASVVPQAAPQAPTLPQATQGPVAADALRLQFEVAHPQAVYEAQWQVSRSPDFSGTVFDVWGDATRAYNWAYVGSERKDTQAGVDIRQLALGELLAKPRAVFPNNSALAHVKAAIVPGGNDLYERWGCARKSDQMRPNGTVGDRQCFARISENGQKVSPFNPLDGQDPVPQLALQSNQTWYWRVRVRDEALNWSGWSDRPSPTPRIRSRPATSSPRCRRQPARASARCSWPSTRLSCAR